jgi:hypothetical protein
LQNITGSHADTWQQKLAGDFPSLFGFLFPYEITTDIPPKAEKDEIGPKFIDMP